MSLSNFKFNKEYLNAIFVLYSFIKVLKLCDFTFIPAFASTGIIYLYKQIQSPLHLYIHYSNNILFLSF